MKDLAFSVKYIKGFGDLLKNTFFVEKFQHIDAFYGEIIENREKISLFKDIQLNNKVNFEYFGYTYLNKLFPKLTKLNDKDFLIESDKMYILRLRKITQGDFNKALEEIKDIQSLNFQSVKEEYKSLINKLKSKYFDFNCDVILDTDLEKIILVMSSCENVIFEEFSDILSCINYLKSIINTRKKCEKLMIDIKNIYRVNFNIGYTSNGFLLKNDKGYLKNIDNEEDMINILSKFKD